MIKRSLLRQTITICTPIASNAKVGGTKGIQPLYFGKLESDSRH